MPKYGVGKIVKTKVEANKIARKARKACYGATVTEVSDGFMVRRTNTPLKRCRIK